jgi:hypothetical protein
MLRTLVPMIAVASVGCAGWPAEPATVAQPQLAFDPVPYPPPPARSETVPPAPNKDAVWVDGGWRWRGKHWSWWLGRWVVPPAGAHYARETVVRSKSGALLAAPGAWYDAEGAPMEEPQVLAYAVAEEGDVVDVEGHMVTVGKNRRANREGPRFSPACAIGAPPDGAPLAAGTAESRDKPSQDKR